MDNLIPGVSAELFIILAVNFLFLLILLIMHQSNRSKLKRLKAKYVRFMGSLSEGNIEELLGRCIDDVRAVGEKNKEIENHINRIERNLLQCVQKVGIVRFNAFENVGSDLSFSIALLDHNDNGIVLSGIYARDSTSTYAKPIVAGKSRYALSGEETHAIDIARKSHHERVYIER